MKYKQTQVVLNTPEAIKYSNIYYLENVEDILKQLFEETSYKDKVHIGNNEAGQLCANVTKPSQIKFDVYIENLDDNILSYTIFGDIDLNSDDFILNRTSLESFTTHNIRNVIPLGSGIKVNLKKIETGEEHSQTETKFAFKNNQFFN